MSNSYNFKQKALSALTAFTLIGGPAYAVLKPTVAIATRYDFQLKIDEITGEEYLEYTVQEGDTASWISAYATGYFIDQGEVSKEEREYFKSDENHRCENWPGVVYKTLEERTKEKGRPVTKFRIHPGDKLRLPAHWDEFKAYTHQAKKSGWYSKYCQANGIYPKIRIVYIDPEYARERVADFLSDYPDVCVDGDVRDAYLSTIGKYNNIKYVYKDNAVLVGDDDWKLGDLVLTPDEIIYPKTKQKTKTR